MSSVLHKGLLGMVAVIAALLSTGCIFEDQSDCVVHRLLYVSVDPLSSPDGLPPASELDTATLFLFDGRGVLLQVVGIDRAGLESGQPVDVEYRVTDNPRVVVWGNLGSVEIPPPVVGRTTFDDLRVTLGGAGDFADAPGNLYYGTGILDGRERQKILIDPLMGRLTLTVRGLEPEPGDSYYFTVETAFGGYDFNSTPIRLEGALRVGASMNASGDLTSGEPLPVFAYPAEHEGLEPVRVSFFRVRNGETLKIAHTETDDRAEDIIPQVGHRVNVLMNLGSTDGRLEVVIRVTDWDEVELWENW